MFISWALFFVVIQALVLFFVKSACIYRSGHGKAELWQCSSNNLLSSCRALWIYFADRFLKKVIAHYKFVFCV